MAAAVGACVSSDEDECVEDLFGFNLNDCGACASSSEEDEPAAAKTGPGRRVGMVVERVAAASLTPEAFAAPEGPFPAPAVAAADLNGPAATPAARTLADGRLQRSREILPASAFFIRAWGCWPAPRRPASRAAPRHFVTCAAIVCGGEPTLLVRGGGLLRARGSFVSVGPAHKREDPHLSQ